MSLVLIATVIVGVLCLDSPRLDRFDAGTVLLDRHSRPLRIRLGGNDQDCRPIDYDEISNWAKQALIAAEDQRFAYHVGVDPIALIRAIGQNIWCRKRISGASTITTQVIRLAEPRPRTILTKLIEAGKAMRVEWTYSKDDILAQHINRAPFGGNLKGIESAARIYFDKSAADLTLAESALLMGVPQSPARLRPDRRPAAARKRMHYVLERMQHNGMITTAEWKAAERQPLDAHRGHRPFHAPHFCNLVLSRHRQSGQLTTTLDLDMQQAIESIVARHASELSQRGIYGAAVVVLDVKTGGVRAMIGSPDYNDRDHAGMVNSTVALRSPGSALKPFVYAMGLDQGIITPGTTVDDKPLVYRDVSPSNFDGTFQGAVSVREALILSLNTPAVRLAQQLGVQQVISTLQALGLTSINRPSDQYGVGIALGNAEVSMLELANAYACLARGGLYLPYRLCETGDKRAEATPVFAPETAYMVADMLGGTERSMALFGHVADAILPRIAWKTGTSSGFRDAWTIAWNPDYVVAVWVGNPDGSATPGTTGADEAAPIAGDIVRTICGSNPDRWFRQPDRLEATVLEDGTRDWTVPGVSAPAAHALPHSQKLIICEPANGSRYRLLETVPHQQAIALRATADDAPSLHWFANGKHIGTSVANAVITWPLERGTWTIACCTQNGDRDTISLTVQ